METLKELCNKWDLEVVEHKPKTKNETGKYVLNNDWLKLIIDFGFEGGGISCYLHSTVEPKVFGSIHAHSGSIKGNLDKMDALIKEHADEMQELYHEDMLATTKRYLQEITILKKELDSEWEQIEEEKAQLFGEDYYNYDLQAITLGEIESDEQLKVLIKENNNRIKMVRLTADIKRLKHIVNRYDK